MIQSQHHDARLATTSRLAGLAIVGPPENFDSALGTAALVALQSLAMPLTLEVWVEARRVTVAVLVPPHRIDQVSRALCGAVPMWEASPLAALPTASGSVRGVALIERAGSSFWQPLGDSASNPSIDGLTAFTEAVQPLDDDELCLLRLQIQPAAIHWRQDAERAVTLPSPGTGVFGLLGLMLGTAPRVRRFDAPTHRAIERRLQEPAFEVIGAVAVSGERHDRLMSRSQSLTAAVHATFADSTDPLQLRIWSWSTDRAREPKRTQNGPPLYLTARELATLWHAPTATMQVSGARYSRRIGQPAPMAVRGTHGLMLGLHDHRGQEAVIRLPRADLDRGHAVVLGCTGVGKTTFVQQLLAQIAADPDRPGLCFIDPHGDAALDLARRGIPAHREADVVLLELGNPDLPVGLPIFQQQPGIPRDLTIQSTFSLIRLLFRDHWSATRLEDAVFALTASLCSRPDSTLLDIPKLLTDRSFRGKVMRLVDDPIATEFWDDFERMSESARREVARPVLYRVRSLYRSRTVRRILCQTEGVNFSDLLARGRIILVSLAGPAIQAEADLLGELIIARLHLAALARLSSAPEARRPFYLAVDESQRFRGASLPVLLSEGRKLGMPLILSTQYLDGWGESLAESVLGNVGTVVTFRSGPNDSRRLSANLKPFSSDDLENLDRYEAIAKLQIDGATFPAFAFRTVAVDGTADDARLERIRQRTVRNYGARTIDQQSLLSNEKHASTLEDDDQCDLPIPSSLARPSSGDFLVEDDDGDW